MSVEEIIKEVVTIKNVSNELSGMTASWLWLRGAEPDKMLFQQFL
mgnify:CR=1 FL=1